MLPGETVQTTHSKRPAHGPCFPVLHHPGGHLPDTAVCVCTSRSGTEREGAPRAPRVCAPQARTGTALPPAHPRRRRSASGTRATARPPCAAPPPSAGSAAAGRRTSPRRTRRASWSPACGESPSALETVRGPGPAAGGCCGHLPSPRGTWDTTGRRVRLQATWDSIWHREARRSNGS